MAADKKLDSKKLKKELSTKRTSFATNEELFLVTKCLPGALPPFGSLFGKKTLCDKSLLENEKISFNSGERTKSIEMKLSTYLNIENPKLVEITK